MAETTSKYMRCVLKKNYSAPMDYGFFIITAEYVDINGNKGTFEEMWIGYKYSGDLSVGFIPEGGIVTVGSDNYFNIDDIAVFTIIDGDEDSLKNEYLIEWLEENCDIEILTQRIEITSEDFVRLRTRGKLCEQDILIVPKLKAESGEAPITAELEVTPSLQEQIFLPSAYDADYFNQVAVKKIPDKYITQEWDGTFTVTGEPTTDSGSGGTGSNTFTFKIGGTEYTAEAGMSWEQWVNSKYNTINAFISSNIVAVNDDSTRLSYRLGSTYRDVTKLEGISSTTEYTIINVGGGGGGND